MKVAIIGSGISGLAAAHTLAGAADITLLEAGSYFGGHTHTVDITLPTPHGNITHGVDTGFLVLNERTYPNLILLLSELGVTTAMSDMSFSVQASEVARGRALEWSGSNLNSLFAQRRNVLNWRFLNMLRDVLRFNKLTTRIALSATQGELTQSLGDFLQDNGFGTEFCDWYFLPMMACIWSCPTRQMLRFPVATMIHFCHNHGLIQIRNRPQWWTVQGGAKHYVEKMTAKIRDKRLNTPVRHIERIPATHSHAGGVNIATDGTHERFDKVIIATHSDQALALLRQPTVQERNTLGAITYHGNRAVLHTDASVLPRRKVAWAAWNFQRAMAHGSPSSEAKICLHYLINRLQPLPWQQPVLVSLNPACDIATEHVLGEYEYEHPVFDLAAIAAQKQMPMLQGQQDTYYCGAWMGYGFHEDGLKAGMAAARQLLGDAGLAAKALP